MLFSLLSLSFWVDLRFYQFVIVVFVVVVVSVGHSWHWGARFCAVVFRYLLSCSEIVYLIEGSEFVFKLCFIFGLFNVIKLTLLCIREASCI